MADNVQVTAGSGTTIAADDIGAGVLVQRTKTTWGPDGTANDTDIASGKPMPMQLRGSDGTDRSNLLPVSAASLPLPSGASTAAKQPALGTAGAASTDVLSVQGIASGTALAVSAASLPLPSGAATLAKQPALGTAGTASADVITIQGIASGTVVPVSDGAGSLTVDNAGTFAVQAAGDVAHDGADSGNPAKVGGRARSSEIAAVSNNDRSDFVTDLVGKQIVLPYANPENFVSGAITSAMTGTTSTSLIAAPASGLRNYITQITVSNSHATVGTDIIIQDGSGGTTLYVIPAASAFGGAVLTFPTPLRQPTTATAIYCANVTTGANTKVSASGYKGA